MPELPEVEVTRQGIAPAIEGALIVDVKVRIPRLRWPIPQDLGRKLAGVQIQKISRRGKYLLFHTNNGTLLCHLGMSGNLKILPHDLAPQKHDHVDIVFQHGQCLRFHDPRRFGAVLWIDGDPYQHPLLATLGPEPFSAQCSGAYLYQYSRGRTTPVKTMIMNSHVVVGVGNIYANEALFAAKILPTRQAGKVSLKRYQQLANHIKKILEQAIQQGGTTLRDFFHSDGNSGYFQLHLKVYGRKGLDCLDCDSPIRSIKLGQRSTFYCGNCQH